MQNVQEDRRISVRFEIKEYEKLKKIADEKNMNISETVRELIFQQLEINGATSGIDIIRQSVREEIRGQITPFFNRIIALLCKVGIMDVTMCFFNGMIIEGLVPREDNRGFKPLYEGSFDELKRKARSNAAAYLNNRNDVVAKDLAEEIKKDI